MTTTQMFVIEPPNKSLHLTRLRLAGELGRSVANMADIRKDQDNRW